MFCLGVVGAVGSRVVEFKPTEANGQTMVVVVSIMLMILAFVKARPLGTKEGNQGGAK